MIELQRRPTEPGELTAFRAQYPNAGPDDWDRGEFANAKKAVKSALNADQGGLCVYCEREIADDAGHVEHIKPKDQNNGRPDLCFAYTNLAQSCDSKKSCGHRKGNRFIVIEPGPNCNQEFEISTDGSIVPRSSLTRKRKELVRQTCDILGFNRDPGLVEERKKAFDNFIQILEQFSEDAPLFLEGNPFRHIMATLL